ncbi:MAG: TRAP transporter TatT component family protein [Bacteroidetes bacterium]|nr:TRAP transporter TatT component family protein [Bacteroidota bacterium]
MSRFCNAKFDYGVVRRLAVLVMFSATFMLGVEGCSITQLTIGATGGIIKGAFEAMNRETDLQLAADAIPGDLKLLDGLILEAPNDKSLLLLGAQGYTSYALGFVEGSSASRASLFYMRARNYGLRILFENKDFKKNFGGDLADFQQALDKFGKQNVPAVFWTANAWGSYINLNRDNVDALADLPKVEAMMKFVLKYEPSYFYGGAHLFFGTILGSLPAMFGGDTTKSRENFDSAIQASHGKFLMTYYYYAKTYAVMTQNKDLFKSLLEKVIDAPVNLLPDQNLANQIAKAKAKALLKNENDYF